KAGKPETQGITRSPRHDGDWLNDDQLFVTDAKAGDSMVLEFETTAPMSGEAAIFTTRANDYGIVEVKLDDKVLTTFDGYAENINRARVPLGPLQLQPGKHTLTVTVTGKNPES